VCDSSAALTTMGAGPVCTRTQTNGVVFLFVSSSSHLPPFCVWLCCRCQQVVAVPPVVAAEVESGTHEGLQPQSLLLASRAA
jgi:hypothetical protein